jgi:hypothetical protein
MRTLTKLACSLAASATFAFAGAPAHAQFEGTDQMAQFAPMIEQFAPMIEQLAPMMQKMQGKLGKKGTAQMMQMVGPMMSMMAPGGDSPAGLPGLDGIMNMMGDGPGRHARRYK